MYFEVFWNMSSCFRMVSSIVKIFIYFGLAYVLSLLFNVLVFFGVFWRVLERFRVF